MQEASRLDETVAEPGKFQFIWAPRQDNNLIMMQIA